VACSGFAYCICECVAVDCVSQALYNAFDEEECLASELEKEQQAALESAMLQEQSYLQEIAREQSTEIHVDTEPDTEHEDHSAPVSLLSYMPMTTLRFGLL